MSAEKEVGRVKEPMALRIEQTESGNCEIWLDDTKLHHVKNYKIESLPFKGKVELSIKMLVRYPVGGEEENTEECSVTTAIGDERPQSIIDQTEDRTTWVLEQTSHQ